MSYVCLTAIKGGSKIAKFVKMRKLMTEKPNVWTDDRLEGLKKLWSQGLSISQIGEALGVSRNSIAGKAHRMGLPKRPSPISRSRVERPKTVVPEMPQSLPLRLELRQLEWSRNKCCWPTGDPKKNGFLFCSQPIVPCKPYCLKHCYEAYTTTRDSN